MKDQALYIGRFYVWITGFTVIPAFYLLFLMFMFLKPQMCKQRLSFCFLATQTQIRNVSTLIKIYSVGLYKPFNFYCFKDLSLFMYMHKGYMWASVCTGQETPEQMDLEF